MGSETISATSGGRPSDGGAGGNAADDTALPKHIRHYKVIREIGKGGMGRVIKCLDTTLNRYVALKMLHSHFSTDVDFIERFKREALAVAKTRHQNIVQIYSIDQEDEIVFFTMEYVEGEGLDGMLARRGKLAEKEAVTIMIQAAEGLSHVHSAGILHRDLKPSNLLLDSSGRVMISDFGLAKMDYQGMFKISTLFSTGDRPYQRNPGETDPETIIGTPYYIAPECLRGREPDSRSDLYSMGIVFYEMLVGRLPFQGDTPSQIFRGHLNEMPPPIGELSPETSLKVANIVYRCIEKETSARYADCGELLRDLREVSATWNMAKEIEERKRLSIEMARAMIPEKHSSRGPRNLARIIALLMVLVLFAALMLISADLFKSIPKLPPGSSATDSVWATSRSARIFGEVQSVARGDKTASIMVKRVFEEGQVLAEISITLKALEEEGALPIKSGESYFFEGVVTSGEKGPFLRVPDCSFVWRAPRAAVFGLEEKGERSIDPVAIAESAEPIKVRLHGAVLSRKDLTDGHVLILIGDGSLEDWLFEVDPTSDAGFKGTDVRTGDTADFNGHAVLEEPGLITIPNARLLNHLPRENGKK